MHTVYTILEKLGLSLFWGDPKLISFAQESLAVSLFKIGPESIRDLDLTWLMLIGR